MISYLCLGSNLGDSELLLKSAQTELCHRGISILRCSKSRRSKAYGFTEQQDFLNQVLEVETKLSAGQLLDACKSIERSLGREQGFRWGPRLIDIDILFYGAECITSEALQIPHGDLHNRHFVLVLLMELIPSFQHPILKKSIKELYENISHSGGDI